jgi:hypothetical protein
MNRTRLALLPSAFAIFLALTGGQGCETLESAKDAQGDLCCTDFVVGADLSNVDWKIEGDTKVQYAAFMQATGDFSAAASLVVEDVARACKNIATDLGDAPNVVTETAPNDRARKWCERAVAKLKAAGSASIKLGITPPSCTVEASAQASCEGKCSGKAECQFTPAQIAARCDPAMISGKCSATCTGTCEGSVTVAVSCSGQCDGTCEGSCDGGTEGSAECAGKCEGKCKGSCKAEAGATAKCEADCTGGCSVEYAAPKCKAELTPPSAECNADVDCNASCKASASAKAECKPAVIEVDASASGDLAATVQANLPVFIEIAQIRGKILADNAKALVEIGGRIGVKGSGDLGVKGVACLVPAASAAELAVKNVGASLDASVSITGSFGQ